VVLDVQPSANVLLGLSSGDTREGEVSPVGLTFTSGNWDTAQTVTVTGVADAVVDGDQGFTVVTGALSSSDGYFDGVPVNNVFPTNIDNGNHSALRVCNASLGGGLCCFELEVGRLLSSPLQ
jgi:hypothetical protein